MNIIETLKELANTIKNDCETLPIIDIKIKKINKIQKEIIIDEILKYCFDCINVPLTSETKNKFYISKKFKFSLENATYKIKL